MLIGLNIFKRLNAPGIVSQSNYATDQIHSFIQRSNYAARCNTHSLSLTNHETTGKLLPLKFIGLFASSFPALGSTSVDPMIDTELGGLPSEIFFKFQRLAATSAFFNQFDACARRCTRYGSYSKCLSGDLEQAKLYKTHPLFS
ncbi:hypothetical protein LENED_000793 [Lentinula edodes]|uniref:Uncharacterized protein n=1 Tax=Lentinula edodes TaxID=5353 RepID=A0A1Q3DWG9_LENED|nr:hypothetical protein LENED_000793 [Lentinula edodes]